MNKKRIIIIVAIILVIIAVLFIYINKDKETSNNLNESETETYVKEYTSSEWKEYARKYYEQGTGNTPVDIQLYTDGKDVMIIEIYDSNDENSNFVERYNLDYKTGIGVDLQGNDVDLGLE
jgi:uncharacterized protein YxeA